MVKSNLKLLAVCICLTGLGLGACQTVESIESQVLFQFALDPAAGVVKKTYGVGDIEFNSGFVHVAEIEVEAEMSNDLEIEYEREQRVKVDLSTVQNNPVVNPLLIPAGQYEEISFDIELEPVNGEPSALLEGFFIDSNQDQILLEIHFYEDIEFEVELENVLYDPNQVPAIVTISPPMWFGTITLNQLEQADRTNGVVIISKNDNPGLYQAIVSALDEGFELEIGN